MYRIRELWDGWWKVIGIFALIGAAVWMVHSCQQAERGRFVDCLHNDLPAAEETLYYGRDAYYDQINRDDAIDVATKCYDNSSIDPDAEPPDYR